MGGMETLFEILKGRFPKTQLRRRPHNCYDPIAGDSKNGKILEIDSGR